VMTGTGSAVFGIFDDENMAKHAFNLLSEHYREVFLAEPQGVISI